MKRIVAETLARFGRIDVLVNNAGGMLGRVPDLTGFDFWVSSVRGGRSIAALIESFQVSNEYKNRVT